MQTGVDWDLTGKVALVTADRRGWTSFFVSALAEAGAEVVVSGSVDSDMNKAAGLIGAEGHEAVTIEAELDRPGDADRVVTEVIAQFGRIDVLVNNAQLEFAKPLIDTTVDEWNQVMDFNVRSMFLFSRAVGQHMLTNGGGRIINMGSGLAERGLVNSAVACAAQGAIKQLTAVLGLEWSKHNVRVNGIGAGWLTTEASSQVLERELLVRFIPSRHKGHPSDLCGLLVYLASDASDFVTGQMIYVDGGVMSHA